MTPVVLINQKPSLLSRIGRWTAELVFVFVGVYAAFWLNNYQEHRQDAERRDQILASFEQQLREGIESGRIDRAKQEQKAAEIMSGPLLIELNQRCFASLNMTLSSRNEV